MKWMCFWKSLDKLDLDKTLLELLSHETGGVQSWGGSQGLQDASNQLLVQQPGLNMYKRMGEQGVQSREEQRKIKHIT